MSDVNQQRRERLYENLVALKYRLYNSLFLTLPLDAVEQTGLLLPLLDEACQRGLQGGQNPSEILAQFFAAHRPEADEGARNDFLFKVIQYVERQIVLVDALEDAAFADIHQTDESDRLRQLVERAEGDGLQEQLSQLLQQFSASVVLTAHPTQFYPGSVLAIITDLAAAIEGGDLALARSLLQQLGITPFFNKEKPTPSDEAKQLCWYLSNIFYPAVGDILDRLADMLGHQWGADSTPLSVGFWPGGDRDGNPFVTSEVTLEVAANLRFRILECYHSDLRKLKRRLSFAGIFDRLDAIEKRIHGELTQELDSCFESIGELQDELSAISRQLREDYQGLFVGLVDSLARKLAVFGLHFASLDIRQDSRVLGGLLGEIRRQWPNHFPADFDALDSNDRIDALQAVSGTVDEAALPDPLQRDTLLTLKAMRQIQERNGEAACRRFIISNTRGAEDVANAIALFRLAGCSESLTVDIVPLFETIDDLQAAGEQMTSLYQSTAYRRHLERRGNRQTIMLGFSDGTKDGGYLMANWAIYRAKEELTRVSRLHEVEVVFFDGRGGPPARGGGSTYNFYAALGESIESNQIQLTVQGQTISSYYGTPIAAQHNLRQLLAAGLENNLYRRPRRNLDQAQRALIEELAQIAHRKYQEFKAHPLFLPYLDQMSTLNYYADSNIASRPSKRGGDSALQFEDLRAIPFVGAWGQLKQNVPGYFGLGSALKDLESQGRFDECRALYRESGFFEALIGNSMQSMRKSNFELTAHMERHAKFGEFWRLIHDEFILSLEMSLKVSDQTVLLEDNATSRHSIDLRQRVVMPILIIQQHALMRLDALKEEAGGDADLQAVYEKMVVRSLFGNINASRNSA